MVHRDIKPANVFLLKDGTVKVADFGIAHVDSSSLTQAGTVMGTPSYMSPEQVLGLPVDGRSDLFSAGVILYQFLTGERPFAGSATTTVQKVLKEDPLPPSTLNVQLPDAIDAVVRKALAKRPEERYQSAAEFAAALRAAVGPRAAVASLPAAAAHDTGAEATDCVRPAAEPTAVARAGGQAALHQPPARRRRRAASQATAVAIVGGVAALAIAAGRSVAARDRASPPAVTAAAPATATPPKPRRRPPRPPHRRHAAARDHARGGAAPPTSPAPRRRPAPPPQARRRPSPAR